MLGDGALEGLGNSEEVAFGEAEVGEAEDGATEAEVEGDGLGVLSACEVAIAEVRVRTIDVTARIEKSADPLGLTLSSIHQISLYRWGRLETFRDPDSEPTFFHRALEPAYP